MLLLPFLAREVRCDAWEESEPSLDGDALLRFRLGKMVLADSRTPGGRLGGLRTKLRARELHHSGSRADPAVTMVPSAENQAPTAEQHGINPTE